TTPPRATSPTPPHSLDPALRNSSPSPPRTLSLHDALPISRFTVGKAEDLTALGFTEHTQVPWRVISGLPEGGVLSEANARATSTSTNATANTAESTNGTR